MSIENKNHPDMESNTLDELFQHMVNAVDEENRKDLYKRVEAKATQLFMDGKLSQHDYHTMIESAGTMVNGAEMRHEQAVRGVNRAVGKTSLRSAFGRRR